MKQTKLMDVLDWAETEVIHEGFRVREKEITEALMDEFDVKEGVAKTIVSQAMKNVEKYQESD